MRMLSSWQLELVIAKNDAETFCEWIRLNWGLEPVTLERPLGATSVVVVYFETEALAKAHKRMLPAKFGISTARIAPCREEQWLTFWRHHFHVQNIGHRLRTVPVWEKPPDRRRINLWIDPGLSFGTGEHFTTRFCLEQLERACQELKPRSMLDAGTGSGILAIAAAKFGVKRVAAFDHDPVCVAKSRENARLNHLGKDRIRFYQADVMGRDWPGHSADVVCANILTNILIEAAPALWQATRKRLILTGIRETEGDAVAQAFLALGARETLRDGDGEWCGLVVEHPRPGKR